MRHKRKWASSDACIIVGHVRSGSTFLAHCLSSHPEIHCFRSEPLEPGSIWFKKLNARGPAILDVVLEQWGYKVSACKLTLKHLTPRIRRYLKRRKNVKIIKLSRENVLRTAISAIIHTRYRRGGLKGEYGHSYESVNPANIIIPPADLLVQCKRVGFLQARLDSRVRQLGKPILSLNYAELVGGDNPGVEVEFLLNGASARICEFLGVGSHPMKAGIKRVNRYPLSETVRNWTEVAEAVAGSKYAVWLEGEDES